MIRSELLGHQRKRAILEMKEAELEGQLATHNAESEAVVADLEDHSAMKEKLVRSTIKTCLALSQHSLHAVQPFFSVMLSMCKKPASRSKHGLLCSVLTPLGPAYRCQHATLVCRSGCRLSA
jgi:hypothetical protein